MNLMWCLSCNMPVVIGNKCPKCGLMASTVFTPEGDLRPASLADIRRIRASVDAFHGEGCGAALIPDGGIAVIVRTTDSEAVIVNGAVALKLSFAGDSPVAYMTLAGLRMISGSITAHRVTCGHDATHFAKLGRSVMASGVISVGDSISKGDRVAVYGDSGKVVAVGIAKMDGNEMRDSGNGVAIGMKETHCARFHGEGLCPSWMEVLELNSRGITGAATGAAGYMRSNIVRKNLRSAVLFTGDVRSETVALLALDAGLGSVLIPEEGSFDKEAYGFIRFYAESKGMEIIDGRVSFGSLLPSMKEYGASFCLTGERIPSSPMDVPDIKGMRVMCPIKDWTPLMPWLFLMLRKEPFAPQYMRGERYPYSRDPMMPGNRFG